MAFVSLNFIYLTIFTHSLSFIFPYRKLESEIINNDKSMMEFLDGYRRFETQDYTLFGIIWITCVNIPNNSGFVQVYLYAGLPKTDEK